MKVEGIGILERDTSMEGQEKWYPVLEGMKQNKMYENDTEK